MALVSDSEIRDLIEGIANDVRIDGRGRREWRPFEVSVGVAPNAQGSAMVTLGNTQVIVGITMSIGEVQVPEEEQGSLTIEVDASSNAWKGNAARVDTFAVQKTLKALSASVGYTLSKLVGASTDVQPDPLTQCVWPQTTGSRPASRCGIDYGQLYIGAGHCFRLRADVTILNCEGGNVYSAASLALKAALLDTKLPKTSVSQPIGGTEVSVTVDNDPSKMKPLSVDHMPILLGLMTHQGFYAVDPSYEEELLPSITLLGVSEGKIAFTTCVAGLRSGGVAPTPLYAADLVLLLEEGALIGDEVTAHLHQATAEGRERP